MEYYKLSFLRKIRAGSDWEEIYIEINNGKPTIELHEIPPGIERPLKSKVEAVTEAEFRKVWSDSRVDFGH